MIEDYIQYESNRSKSCMAVSKMCGIITTREALIALYGSPEYHLNNIQLILINWKSMGPMLTLNLAIVRLKHFWFKQSQTG